MPGILNAATNAAAGLATFQSLGSNLSLAQTNATLLGANIPGIPLISFRDYFLTSMESWVSTIPLRTQFIALFERFPVGINTNILRGLEGTDYPDINNAKTALASYPLQNVVGCMFLQGADIPTETLAATTAPIDHGRGFLQGNILDNRDPFSNNNLTLQFRETNTSFTDFIIRPWLILAAHNGYVARNMNDSSEALKNPKTNIILVQYSRSYQNISQIPRKVWKFYDCVPLGLSTRNLTYDTESMEQYSVPFLYDRYTVENNLYIPLPDLISKIGRGNIPRISPFQR
jgi:hypothetical protein